MYKKVKSRSLCSDDLIVHRPSSGFMAGVLRVVMPPETKPLLVWPELVQTVRKEGYFKVHKLALIAIVTLVSNIAILFVLHSQLPMLKWSVVKLLASLFGMYMSPGFALATAWTLGMAFMLSTGPICIYTQFQQKVMSKPATRLRLYDFILRASLIEEQIFRSGSEKWTWLQCIRSSLLFGFAHVVNIWVSIGAGLVLGLSGFVLMLVYLFYYRKTGSQIIATSASATAHAIYNMIAIGLILVLLTIMLLSWLITVL